MQLSDTPVWHRAGTADKSGESAGHTRVELLNEEDEEGSLLAYIDQKESESKGVPRQAQIDAGNITIKERVTDGETRGADKEPAARTGPWEHLRVEGFVPKTRVDGGRRGPA